MSWPDDNEPRYIVDAQPSVRVLDRAHAFKVVREFDGQRRSCLDRADMYAAALNANDQLEDEAA